MWPTLTYGRETRTTNTHNRVWRTRPLTKLLWAKEVHESVRAPVTNTVKDQRIRRFKGRITTRGANETVSVGWGKKSSGKPGKRRINVVEENLKTLGVIDWREVVDDGDGWQSAVMTTKTLREQSCGRRRRLVFYSDGEVPRVFHRAQRYQGDPMDVKIG